MTSRRFEALSGHHLESTTYSYDALALRERVELGPHQLFGLVGVGLSNFQLDVESPPV